MILEGHRCRVRRWKPADVHALVEHANNARVAAQLRDRFPHPYTRRDALAFLEHAIDAPQPTNLAIDVDGQAVGAIGYLPGTDIERFSGEIGYWVGEAYWGRGIATEAVVLMTRCAFEQSNMLRLFALPFADNAGSIRVLEKAGYTREAILRASCVKDGRVRDQALYARINTCWKGDPA